MPAFETVRLGSIATVLTASERLHHPLTVEQRQELIQSLEDVIKTLRTAAGSDTSNDAQSVLESETDLYQREVVTLEGKLAPRAFEILALSLASEEITARPIVLLTHVVQQLTNEKT